MLQSHRKSRKQQSTAARRNLLLMVIPFILFVFAFSYVPLIGWILAFFNYKPGIPLNMTPFVGLKYFLILFSEGGTDLLRVMFNTLVFSFLGILLSPLPVVFAILLNEVRSTRFKKLIQTTTTLPNFISWVLVFSLAFSMFSGDGMLNTLLARLRPSSGPVEVLGNINIVFLFQTALVIWKSLGWSSIIYLAGISGIDSELYDAAKVDGAGRIRTIMHITVPGISATYIVLLLLQISNLLASGGGLDQYLVFYNSLVADKIEVLDYYVYRLGIVTQDYSYATAIGMLKSLVSILLLFSVNFISKKVRGTNII
jgi:ABC-type polysaccharide transport system permease subunit